MSWTGFFFVIGVPVALLFWGLVTVASIGGLGYEGKTMEYNGWTNRETWLVMLWIDNSDRDYFDDMARNVLDDTERDSANYPLSRMLEEHFENEAADMLPSAGLFSDMLNASLSSVNWAEIACSLLYDIEG